MDSSRGETSPQASKNSSSLSSSQTPVEHDPPPRITHRGGLRTHTGSAVIFCSRGGRHLSLPWELLSSRNPTAATGSV